VRSTRSGGVTLLEVMIALFLLFMASFFILEMFGQALLTFSRSKDFTVATFLAQQKMEEVLYLDTIPGQSGSFSAPFDVYTFTVAMLPYNGMFNTLRVDVSGPRGVRSRLVALKSVPAEFVGVATDLASSIVAEADPATNKVRLYSGDSFTTPLTELPSPSLPVLPTVGQAGKPAGVAQDFLGGTVWVGDRINKLLYVAYLDSPSPIWTATATPPLGVPSGVATDAHASTVWVGIANPPTGNGIQRYNADAGTWGAVLPLPGGGQPAGLATDASGNFVWVANMLANKVQVYDSGAGTWGSDLAPGGGFIEGPRGLAVTSQGQFLWVADLTNLYRYDGSSWSAFPLPTALQTADTRALGLATDQFGNLVWLHTTDNTLWVYDGATFVRKRP